MASPGSLFSMHFEYLAMGKNIRISFSNLFKTVKVISETTVQIPFKESLTKWSIICIDVKSIIRELFILNQDGKAKKHNVPIPEEKNLEVELQSVQLCAKLFVKGVYTSDSLYNVKTLPKEIGFRLAKGEDFDKSYNWYIVDSFLNPDILSHSKGHDKENDEFLQNEAIAFGKTEELIHEKQEKTKSSKVLETSTTQTKPPVPKPDAKVEADKPDSKPEGDSKRDTLTNRGSVKSSLKTTNRSASTSRPKNKPIFVDLPGDKENNEPEKPKEERPKAQTAPIRESIDSIEPQAVARDTKTIKFKSQQFTLEPNPILSLTHCQGFQSKARNLQFLDDSKIIYSCGNTICLMDINSKTQRFFIGGLQTVKCLAVDNKLNIMASVDDSDVQCKVYLWTLFPQRLDTSFNTGLKSINSCDIATRKENQRKVIYLVVSGRDQLNRNVIAVYDITDFSYKEPYLFCKQISDFDIRCLKFINNRDASFFVTCGKENIRFWKLKHKIITGSSLILGEHARNTLFNDFVVFNYNEANTTEELNAYKLIFCSDQGNVYLVDYKEQELVGIFKLHDSPITTINVNPANHYFISAGEDKIVRLWNMDITQMLLEVKLDSHVTQILINQQDQVVVGCINGTIGELKLDERKIDALVRSHTDSIIMMDYHPLTKNLVTISRDLTIKIWEIRMGYFVLKFEFRCIDEQVTFVRCLRKRESFICGFESGSLRVFDIQKNRNVVLGEMEGHKAQIIDIEVSPDDKYVATVDVTGKIQIYDQNLEFIKELQNDIRYQGQFIDFDSTNNYFLAKYNPNTLRIYKIGTWGTKYSITIEEEIVKASFSSTKGDLFILTSKAKLKRCKLGADNVSVEREYWSLHNGQITDFKISKNCRYIFTVGEDNLLKCWDYFMRGKLTPAFQAFTLGTKFKDVVLSNDETNLVFTYGIENHGIFCFEFRSDLVANIEEEIEEQEPEPVVNRSSVQGSEEFVRSATLVRDNHRSTPMSSAYNFTGEIKSIYHPDEQLLNIPSSTINLRDTQQIQQVENDVEEEEKRRIDQEKIDSVIQATTKPKSRDMATEIVDQLMANKRKVTFQDMERYYFNEENLAEGNLERDLEYKDQEYEPKYKLPGQFLTLKNIIGGSLQEGSQNLIWNYRENYIAYTLGSSIIATYLEEPKSQKYLHEIHIDEIAYLKLSTQKKFIVSASKEAKNESSCNISIWDASNLAYLKTITHSKLFKIHSIDISPDENYILVLGQSNYDPNALLFVWELQSGMMVTNTLYQTTTARYVKWNNIIKSALEFTMLTDDNIILWRLNFKRNLEYQEANFDRLIMKGHKYLALDYLESKLFKDTAFLFIGTSLGTLMVFDTRSNTLLFQINNFIKGPICQIYSLTNRLILTGYDANVYAWKLEKVSDAEQLAKFLQESPDILLTDSKPTAGYFMPELHGTEGILATKGGVVWYLNWEERATLRLSTSHLSNTAVTAVKAHFYGDESMIVSSALDGTVRIWDAKSLEQKIEFHVPRREALCVDIHQGSFKCVCGFSDGYVRFFDYNKNINYGGTQLFIENENRDKRRDDDRPKIYPVSAVCFMNHENNVLAGNMNGEVYMIYIKSWEHMRVEVRALITSAGFAINHLAISETDPWDTWLLCTKNRKVMVWNRKDLNFQSRRDEDYYRRIFSNVNELEYYLIDNYKVHAKGEQENNFDDFNQEVDSYNKYEFQGDTISYFSRKPDLCLVITSQIQEIFFRDYKAHMVFKSLKIEGLPRSLYLREKNSEIIVGTKDGLVRFIEYETGIERDRVSLSQDGIKNIDICLPKQQFSTETLSMEPVGNNMRMFVCSSRNGIYVCKLEN